MRVGCPKEIKNHEYRVGLTPAAVRDYVAHGHQVWIEIGLSRIRILLRLSMRCRLCRHDVS